jgi:hypothetical protein
VFELGAGGDAESFGASIASVAAMGTGGCGFEQQLEAVSPSAPTVHTVPGSVPPVFALGTLSHGDRQNAGFVRPGSALAIVLLTDEEDCSARDPGIFDQAARRTAARTRRRSRGQRWSPRPARQPEPGDLLGDRRDRGEDRQRARRLQRLMRGTARSRRPRNQLEFRR